MIEYSVRTCYTNYCPRLYNVTLEIPCNLYSAIVAIVQVFIDKPVLYISNLE
jgi:hypothetical protein